MPPNTDPEACKHRRVWQCWVIGPDLIWFYLSDCKKYYANNSC